MRGSLTRVVVLMCASLPDCLLAQANAAAPQAVPVTATQVTITSTPSSAEISVDGHFVGFTPSTVGVASGEHTIVITKAGKSWQRKLMVTKGNVSIDATLEEAPSKAASASRAQLIQVLGEAIMTQEADDTALGNLLPTLGTTFKRSALERDQKLLTSLGQQVRFDDTSRSYTLAEKLVASQPWPTADKARFVKWCAAQREVATQEKELLRSLLDFNDYALHNQQYFKGDKISHDHPAELEAKGGAIVDASHELEDTVYSPRSSNYDVGGVLADSLLRAARTNVELSRLYTDMAEAYQHEQVFIAPWRQWVYFVALPFIQLGKIPRNEAETEWRDLLESLHELDKQSPEAQNAIIRYTALRSELSAFQLPQGLRDIITRWSQSESDILSESVRLVQMAGEALQVHDSGTDKKLWKEYMQLQAAMTNNQAARYKNTRQLLLAVLARE